MRVAHRRPVTIRALPQTPNQALRQTGGAYRLSGIHGR